MKRVFLVVMDSVGIGELPDAAQFGDAGSNTLRAAAASNYFSLPNLAKLGLFHIDGVNGVVGEQGLVTTSNERPYFGAVARLAECSAGKDTTTGHWEIAGLVSETPMPTFPEGFPAELLDELRQRWGREILCNRPYSGTKVIADYGKEHIETGALIVYTSADSVLQIAAHESVVPVEELYRYCEIAREVCTGKFAVGRVIARPFAGEWPYVRTEGRHDYSLVPPKKTMLNVLKEAGFDVRGVGKISDIFAGSGITHSVRTKNNAEGIRAVQAELAQEFCGLCFVNLVDFDMLYGHRNDVDGYAKALAALDAALPLWIAGLREEDILILTADHGCDPSTVSTDHSREYVPFVAVGKPLRQGVNVGTRETFADIGKTVLAYFGVENDLAGNSFLEEIRNAEETQR